MTYRLIRTLTVLAVVLFSSPAFGQGAVHVDISGSQVEILGPEALRIRDLTAPGFPGKWAVDFHWNPTTYTFEPGSVTEEAPPPTSTGFMSCPAFLPHLARGSICDYLDIQAEYLEYSGTSCLIKMVARNKTTEHFWVSLTYHFFGPGDNELPTGGIVAPFNGSETKTVWGVARQFKDCSGIARFSPLLEASYIIK